MPKQYKQNVSMVSNVTQARFVAQLGVILATPYAKTEYNEEKTKAVIRSCVKRGHLSVLEHCHITLKLYTNIGTYKDYTRHRHCAFTIESTSFVAYEDQLSIITADETLTADEWKYLDQLMAIYKLQMPKYGRDFLPQCTAANVIMTTNIREWRYIIGIRGDPNDNPLTNELRDRIWITLNEFYPFFFPIDTTEDNPMVIYNNFGKHVPAKLCNPSLIMRD
jgi:thymidylate synthase (FAD)